MHTKIKHRLREMNIKQNVKEIVSMRLGYKLYNSVFIVYKLWNYIIYYEQTIIYCI